MLHRLCVSEKKRNHCRNGCHVHGRLLLGSAGWFGERRKERGWRSLLAFYSSIKSTLFYIMVRKKQLNNLRNSSRSFEMTVETALNGEDYSL